MKTFASLFVILAMPWFAVAADAPPVALSLGSRHGHVTPVRQGFTHTGGGNIDVAQPSPDTVVITMTGVAVAGGHPCKPSVATLNFDLDQCFDVVVSKPGTKAKLTMEGRVIGLLRSHAKGCGTAEQGPGTALITCGCVEILNLTVPPHLVAGGENLSVNCKEATPAIPVMAGTYTLHEKWTITAAHPKKLTPCKAASAEFAPDPALDTLWISYWEPFRGAIKKDFGLQITIKVTAAE